MSKVHDGQMSWAAVFAGNGQGSQGRLTKHGRGDRFFSHKVVHHWKDTKITVIPNGLGKAKLRLVNLSSTTPGRGASKLLGPGSLISGALKGLWMLWISGTEPWPRRDAPKLGGL